jgi:leucyl aminopeptidase (aminopeptidase T)
VTDTALLDRVAVRVLRNSLRVRPGEAVTIETWNTGLGLAQRVAIRARRMGAVPLLLFEDEAAFIDGVRHAPREHLGKMGKHERALLSKTDAYVFIPGPIVQGSPKISQEEFAASTGYNSAWYAAAKKARLRGVRVTFGSMGPELAGLLHRPVAQIVEHQLRSSLIDLGKVRRRAISLSRRLRPRAHATVRTDAGTLEFELGTEEAFDIGRVTPKDVASGGYMVNLPPGYYAREVLASSLHGKVRMYAPVPRIGAVADLSLEFRRGRLVRWGSEANQHWIDRLVQATPKERRTLGAVVVGLNPILRSGFGQDRLVEGAVTFSGLFQGTTRTADLHVEKRPVVTGSAL